MDCELPEFYEAVERTAAKQHVCCECHVPIAKGERYLSCTGKWDDSVQTYKQHLVCAEACMALRDDMDFGECVPFGELFDYHFDTGTYSQTYRKRPEVIKFRALMAQVRRRAYKYNKERKHGKELGKTVKE